MELAAQRVDCYRYEVLGRQIVSDCAGNATEVGRPGASDAVKSQCSSFELYPLRYWQPVVDVTKNRCDVLIFTKANNETSGGNEYHSAKTSSHCV